MEKFTEKYCFTNPPECDLISNIKYVKHLRNSRLTKSIAHKRYYLDNFLRMLCYDLDLSCDIALRKRHQRDSNYWFFIGDDPDKELEFEFDLDSLDFNQINKTVISNLQDSIFSELYINYNRGKVLKSILG